MSHDEPTRPGPDPQAAPTAPMPSQEHLGDDIGPYRLLAVLGEGGFGMVYLAERRTPFVQRVALKVIKPGMDSHAVIARFEQERQALAVLDHPHIARIFDAGVALGGRPFFVMEHVTGETLTAYAQHHSLTLAQRVALLIPVCEAVHHAHERGLIHRDLKPTNLLVSQPDLGGEPFPKVIDFGIARALSHTFTDKALHTVEGTIIGTPEYMSPEQAEGGSDAAVVGPRSDVYSLGIVLFELLTGKLPRDLSTIRNTPAAQLHRLLLQVRPTPAREVNPDVPSELETIILRCMADEPARRYESAAALADDLRRFLDGRPIRARRDTVAYVAGTRIRTLARRQPLAVLAAVWLLTALFCRYLVLPGLFQWTGIGAAYERLMAQTPAHPVPAFDSVAFVIIPEGITQSRLGELAGIPDVSDTELTALRRVHAEVFRRLALAGPRAVAIDLVFASETSHDADLAAGLQALSQASPPIPTVCAVRKWPVDAGATLGIAPSVVSVPGLRFGGISVGTSDQFGYIHLYARREPGPPVPSLALLALAAVHAPDWNPQIDLSSGTDAFGVYYTRPGQGNTVTRFAAVDRVCPTSTQPCGFESPRFNLRTSDTVALAQVLVPPAGVVNAARTDYDEVLTLDPAALRERFQGKVIVVGDARTASNDLLDVGGGRVEPGSYLVGTAIEQLLRGWGVVRPSESADRAILALAAAYGAILGSTLRSRPWTRRGIVLVSWGVLIGVTLAMYALRSVYANPVIACVAVLVASEITALALGPALSTKVPGGAA